MPSSAKKAAVDKVDYDLVIEARRNSILYAAEVSG
jgi:hypothetical protein